MRQGRLGTKPTRLWAALCAAALLGLATRAQAGDPEYVRSVDVNPNDPNQWVVRYAPVGEGFLFSDDAGASWRVSCKGAINAEMTDRTIGAAITGNGDVVTGSFGGMWKVAWGGCSATAVPEFVDTWVPDIVHHPSDPNVLYAITSSGSPEAQNGIFAYDSATDTWSEVGTRNGYLLGRLQVVETDSGVRFYESYANGQTVVGTPPDADYYPNWGLRYSDDNGETWTEFPVFEMTNPDVRLVAVDPTNPDRIIVTQEHGKDAPELDKVWINEQAGDPAAMKMLLEVESFGDALFGPDGTLYIADADGPLHVMAAGETMPSVLAEDLRGTCLVQEPDGPLLACKLWNLVEVTPDGTVSEALNFQKVQEWASCDGKDVAEMCKSYMGGDNRDGWCHISHYPSAPICSAYCFPGFDEEVVENSDGTCELMEVDTSDPVPDDLPDPFDPMSTPTDTGNTGSTGNTGDPMTEPVAGGGAEPAPASDSDSGGCGCRVVSDPSGTLPGWTGLSGLGLLGLLVMRRMRRRGGRR